MRGRPEAHETAPYYFTYIDQVVGDDPIGTLKAQLDEARNLFAGIDEEQSLTRYAPDKWSIREVVNHLSDTERAFLFRALWFARGFSDPLPGYDQLIAVAGAGADRVPFAAHRTEFEQVRAASISLFENLPEEAWLRTGIASDRPFTVRSIAFLTAGHVAHHLRILRERYL